MTNSFMKQALFTIVTGNKGKLAEFRRLLPDSVAFDHVAIDLPEIQSLDSNEIITAKAQAAYANLQRPVLVEDVTAGIDELGGLPGPFIKFFEQKLGKDALFMLRGETSAKVVCTIGYYDGENMIFATGEVVGMAVAPRGNYGFGFDCCFQPEGTNKTYGEMPPEEKDAVSHRSLAVKNLMVQLKRL